MTAYASEQVKRNCWNLYDSFGEICVHCGCCANDKKTRYKARIEVIESRIREQEGFSLWFDDLKMRAVQEKNLASNLKYWRNELEHYQGLLRREDNNG